MPDKIEKILKEIHLFLAGGSSNSKDPDDITINKRSLFELLEKLNYAILEVMDQYEMTQVSKDKAKRKVEREGEQIIEDANKNAEDIYAASLMYTDDALMELKNVIREAKTNILKEYDNAALKIDRQISLINRDEEELYTQLDDMRYGKQYVNILTDLRKKELKQKGKSVNAVLDNILEDNSGDQESLSDLLPASDIVIKVNENHPAFAKMKEKEKKEYESIFAIKAEEKEKADAETYDMKLDTKTDINSHVADELELEDKALEEADLIVSNIVKDIMSDEELADEIYMSDDDGVFNNENGPIPIVHYNPDDFDLDAEFFAWQEEQEKKKKDIT